MAGIKPLNTCNACNFDNPGDAEKCNRCGKSFRGEGGLFGDRNWKTSNFTKRWQCHLCGAKNQWSNKTCHSCGFKSDHSSGGCFITTATCSSLGKGDNCDELTSFRNFRDTWLKTTYPEKINEYYEIAPKIIDKINSLDEHVEIYKRIWDKYLQLCDIKIKEGNLYDAFEIYKEMTDTLKKEYLD